MCINSKRIRNPRYVPNKKNAGQPPVIKDVRLIGVDTKCGWCEECRKEAASNWAIRMYEELQSGLRGMFVTLTFNDEELGKLREEVGDDDEDIARIAVKRFRERYRKDHGKSIRHWIATERGHRGTKRIHMHGILLVNAEQEEELRETETARKKNWQRLGESGETKNLRHYWKYGDVWIGDYCNNRTVNYVMKYITKPDKERPGFKPRLLVSPGLGEGYIERSRGRHAYRGERTNTEYIDSRGRKRALPTYYRRKIWTDEQREEMRLTTLDKNVGYINGVRYGNWNSEEVQRLLTEFRAEMRRTAYSRGYADPKGRRKILIEKTTQRLRKQHYENDNWYIKDFKKRMVRNRRRDAHESIHSIPRTRYAGIGVIPSFQGGNTVIPNGELQLRYTVHDGQTRAGSGNRDNCRLEQRTDLGGRGYPMYSYQTLTEGARRLETPF